MRSLVLNEISTISGGFNCFDADTVQKVKNKAFKDGVLIAFIAGSFTGTLSYVVSEKLFASAAIGLYVAPFAGAAAFYHSSAWNILN